MEHRYVLERYKPGGSNRFVCPQCGKKKSFTRYIDRETGEYVGEECGKCDHEASCGYHYPPREYFRDHPGKGWHADNVNGKPLLGLSRSHSRYSYSSGGQPMEQERHQTEFIDITWAVKSMQRTSTFRRWLEQLAQKDTCLSQQKDISGEERLRQVLADYYVGGTAKDIVLGGINYGPAVVFWLIDEQGRAHDAKLMAYKTDGHRVANYGNSMRSVCMKSHVGPQLVETEKVLFGLHLLPRYPDKPVAIVESEKSAIICACRYPEYVWLATGGCGNLKKALLQPLKGRRVTVFPDSGVYEKWKDCMARSALTDYKVMDFMEQYESNTDIADIILGEAVQKDEILLPPPTEECPF